MGDLTVLPVAEISETGRRLLRYARQIVEKRGDGLQGFLVIGFADEGAITVGADLAGCKIPNALLPGYIAELIRRDFVTETEIRRELVDCGLMAPPPDGAA